MSPEEQNELLAKVKPVATDGRHERFTSTQYFDSEHHKKRRGLTEQEVKD